MHTLTKILKVGTDQPGIIWGGRPVLQRNLSIIIDTYETGRVPAIIESQCSAKSSHAFIRVRFSIHYQNAAIPTTLEAPAFCNRIGNLLERRGFTDAGGKKDHKKAKVYNANALIAQGSVSPLASLGCT